MNSISAQINLTDWGEKSRLVTETEYILNIQR
jgi:hypothetical protein